MLRRNVQAMLALLALVALTGCGGVERIAGPRVEEGGANQARAIARGYHNDEHPSPPREDDGGDRTPGADVNEPITAGADSLRVGNDAR